MKRYIAISTLMAVLALSGCASQGTSPATGGVNSSNAIEMVPDIALVTREATREVPDESEPPQLRVEYTGEGLAVCAFLTSGSSEWEVDGQVTAKCSAGAVECENQGLITARIDLDLIDSSPKILLSGGTLAEVSLYPLDGSDSISLEYSADGTVDFPDDCPDGVVSAQVEFDRGNCEYYFTVTRSQRMESEPPRLRVYSGDYGYEMTRGGYTWTVTDGEEASTMTVDCPSPWQMFEAGYTGGYLCDPGSTITVKLPENSAITSAVYYTAEDSTTALEYSGGDITLPDGEFEAPCRITVEMPQGTCDYVFYLIVATEYSVPACSAEESIHTED